MYVCMYYGCMYVCTIEFVDALYFYICICMYECMYVWRTFSCDHIRLSDMYVCMYVCMYVHTFIPYIRTYMHTWKFIHVNIYCTCV